MTSKRFERKPETLTWVSQTLWPHVQQDWDENSAFNNEDCTASQA